MLKKLLTVLLTVLMVATMGIVNVAAEDDVDPGFTVDPVTQTVADLNAAAVVEGATAAGSLLRPDAGAEVNSTVAAANELLAAAAASHAKEVTDKTNEDLADLAETADVAHGVAHDAKLDAKEDAKEAIEAAIDAKKDVEKAEEGTYKEALEAADHAKEDAEKADAAVADAEIKKNEAIAAAKEARDAYEEALREWTIREAEVKAELAAGLITAVIAEKEAEEALAKIAKYEEAARTAAEEAEKAAKEAEEAKDKATQDLKDAAEELEKAIVENATNVAQKTAVTVVTGAALAATDVAMKVAEEVVDYYDGRVTDLKAKVDELQKAIDEADGHIDNLEKNLAALDETDADYPKALAALEAAQKAKEEAQKIFDNAAALLDQKTEYEADLNAALGQDLTDDANVKALTELVLEIGGNEETVDWQEVEGKNIFKLGDKYYEVKVEEGKVQFHETEQKPTKLTSLAKPSDNYGKNISYTAVGKLTDQKLTVTVGSDRLGKYYEIGGVKYYNFGYQAILGLYDIYDNNNQYWDTSETPTTDKQSSSDIQDSWKSAEDAESSLNAATDALNEATSNYNSAKLEYDRQKDSLETLKGYYEGNKAVTEKEAEEARKTLTELDTKLNGNLLDRILRAVIEGDKDAGADAAERAVILGLKKLLGTATPEEEEELKALAGLEDTLEAGKDILEVIAGLNNGVGLDDVGAIIELLSNAGLSERTKLAIIRQIESVVDELHSNAVDDLKKAVEEAEKEILLDTEILAEAAENKAVADAKYVEAKAKETLAKAVAADAADLLEKATLAEELAEKARKEYEQLLLTYGPDYEPVREARASYIAARHDAFVAVGAYRAAKAAAASANNSYLKAKEIADSKRPQPAKPVVNTAVAF